MADPRLHITGFLPSQGVPNRVTIESAILHTLVYFDIFHYPLTRDEIRSFLSVRASDTQFLDALTQLELEKKIFFINDFYSLQNNSISTMRRKEGNQRAAILIEKAIRIGRFLHRFPFVKSIGISGSLSKNFADEKADIDFFIITKSNRLWIARTFMHLYKKLTFLRGRQHYYCMNYYIDEEALRLDDQNIFTAIELKTLLPVSGIKTMQTFFKENEWTDNWLPACPTRIQQGKDPWNGWVKNMLEWILDSRIGSELDNYLFRVTRKRWERKEKKGRRNMKGQTMGLISGKHFARSNPGNFQEKVLELYRQKIIWNTDNTDQRDHHGFVSNYPRKSV